ncbi:chitinase domain-containing protein 1 [Bacillus rossius redtenbacheri]|uniref:chitinase domain-containing protein 1 n=1 Tax=Bacillus rossius redtenbacheri TaxID=93214 RepID=UPI002FDC7FFA
MNVSGLVLCLLVVDVSCTISASDKKPRQKNKSKKPALSSVVDRKLVVEAAAAADIVTENERYFKNTQVKHFPGPVLGYVTPWNSHGYSVAKTFCAKLSHVSPVWLQVRPQGDRYEVTGTHDVDRDWLDSVRRCGNASVAIVPRVLFDGWSRGALARLGAEPGEVKRLAQTLLKAARQWGFDGVVLEVWTQALGALGARGLADVVGSLARRLRSHGLLVVLVVPPARGHSPELFNREDFRALADDVDAFSLMTYDHASPQRPGANSPLPWARGCVERLAEAGDPRRAKILLGLNFYGYDYTSSGGGPIVNHQYVSLLRRHGGLLKWDDSSQEHYFEVKDGTGRHLVFYPTLYSLHKRLQLAESLGVGLSIWELGQGLDYFYDLF